MKVTSQILVLSHLGPVGEGHFRNQIFRGSYLGNSRAAYHLGASLQLFLKRCVWKHGKFDTGVGSLESLLEDARSRPAEAALGAA